MKSFFRGGWVAWTVLLAGAPASCLEAQNPVGVDQYQRVRNWEEAREQLEAGKPEEKVRAPTLFEGEDQDLGPQYLLLSKPRTPWVHFLADSQYYYTGNMFLQEDAPGAPAKETSLLVNTIQIGLEPSPSPWMKGRLTPRLGYRHQWFQYGLENSAKTLGAFDFNSSDAYAGLHLRTGQNWHWDASLDYLRLLSRNGYSEFYTEWAPHLGGMWVRSINPRSAVMIGVDTHLRFTDTDPSILQTDRGVNDRLDGVLTVGYTRVLGQRLVLQPYYRLQVLEFMGGRYRRDLIHHWGSSMNFMFNRHLSARLFVTYEFRESDDPIVADYRKVDAGGGISLDWRF